MTGHSFFEPLAGRQSSARARAGSRRSPPRPLSSLSRLWLIALALMACASAVAEPSRDVQLAIQEIPLHHWVPISRNTLADVDPCPQRDCGYSAVEGQGAVFTNCTGGAYAPNLGALASLLYWGGGHNGHDGKELYAFSFADLTWERVTDSTTGTDPAKPRDLGLDEEYGFHDGRPIAVHTYDGVAYDPAQRRFYIMALRDSPAPPRGSREGCSTRKSAYFDIHDQNWGTVAEAVPRSLADVVPRSLADVVSVYAPNRERVWVHGSGQWGHWVSLDPEPSEWTLHREKRGWVVIDRVADIDPSRDILVVADLRKGEAVVVWDLARPRQPRVTISTQGATDVVSAQ